MKFGQTLTNPWITAVFAHFCSERFGKRWDKCPKKDPLCDNKKVSQKRPFEIEQNIMEKFRGLIKIRFWYWFPTGPRSHTAGVSIQLSSHDNYEFVSNAQWIYDDYSKAIEHGIIEALEEYGYDPRLGIHITLESVEEDKIDSSEHDFFIAAKTAVLSNFLISKNRKSL